MNPQRSEPPRIGTESMQGRRPYQEDSVCSVTLDDGRTLVAVADGMGGHAAGDVASSLALESLESALNDGKALDEAVKFANSQVHSAAQAPDKKGMGTTLVAFLLEEGRYWIANVGDSRGYLVTDGKIEQITTDHSFVNEAMAKGQSEEEAMASPYKDALTRSIGANPEVEVDLFGPMEVEDRSAVLLCSDGLYKALSDSSIAAVFRESGGPRGAAQSLSTAALDGGSDDNITVAIAEFGEVPRAQAGGTVELNYQPPEDEEEAAAAGDAAGDASGQASSHEEAVVDSAIAEAVPAAASGSGRSLMLPVVLVLIAVAALAALFLI